MAQEIAAAMTQVLVQEVTAAPERETASILALSLVVAGLPVGNQELMSIVPPTGKQELTC